MKNIYLVGIKGVGMTALAVYLKERGKTVWGSDVEKEFHTDSVLHENKIRILKGFSKENITDDIDLVVTTGAHNGLKNAEVIAAKEKGIKVFTLAQEVGQLSKAYKTVIAVCGTHGKTTTSAMLAFIFNKLGLKASHLVGVSRFSGLYGGHFGGEEFLVVEADEYKTDGISRFMSLDPDYIICTNIGFDHPDAFNNLNEVKCVYRQFFKKVVAKPRAKLVYFVRDNNLNELAHELPKEKLLFFDAVDIQLSVSGKHNQINASGVLRVCKLLGLDKSKVRKSLEKFAGSSRRLEHIFEQDGTVLIDDYAHHPVEIASLLEAACFQFPKKRIILIFQPHTYSRTKALFDDFIKALARADQALVLDIFASAREEIDKTVSSQKLVKKAHKLGYENVHLLYEKQVEQILTNTLKSGDVIITAGAGDVYELHKLIIPIIKKLKN